MASNTEQYIRDWFIELQQDKMPISTYMVRKSLLSAVAELQPVIHGRVLDLACGVMPYKKYLMNNKIIEYIGIDLEPTEYHHDVKPDFFWDGKTIPLEDSSVDFILATEFLEHYFDTSSILAEIKRVLKPGGIFFFTVPCIWPLHEAPYDYHRFTPFCLQEHAKKVGFSSVVLKPLGGFHYSIGITLGLWIARISKGKRKLIKPFTSFIFKSLMKKDNKEESFKNGQLISGLYGFFTK